MGVIIGGEGVMGSSLGVEGHHCMGWRYYRVISGVEVLYGIISGMDIIIIGSSLGGGIG
jgi:hypothetical protein